MTTKHKNILNAPVPGKALMDKLMPTQPQAQHYPHDLLAAEYVAFNDAEHDYNKGPFPCQIDSRPAAIRISKALELQQQNADLLAALKDIRDACYDTSIGIETSRIGRIYSVAKAAVELAAEGNK